MPAVVDAGSDQPAESAANGFTSWTVDDEFRVDLERVKAMVASTPLEIVFAFCPEITQVIAPAVLLHKIDLAPAVA
jgi:hypothetical protein